MLSFPSYPVCSEVLVVLDVGTSPESFLGIKPTAGSSRLGSTLEEDVLERSHRMLAWLRIQMICNQPDHSNGLARLMCRDPEEHLGFSFLDSSTRDFAVDIYLVWKFGSQ